MLNTDIKKIYNFFLDKDFKKKQSFHYRPTPKFGGIFLILFLFLSLCFFEKNFFLIKIIIISTFFFFLGFFGDLFKSFRPHHRFLIMILGCLIFLIFFDIKIFDFQFHLFDTLNKKIYFSYLIVLFAIIFIVNGANFIDGFNGLLIIHVMILFAILAYLNYQKLGSNYIFYFCLYLIFIYFILLFLNFPFARIFMGDSGSYLSGSLLAITSIETSNVNPSIPKFLFACILFYLFFEVFFSFFRKLSNKQNPFLPDRFHLHMLLFKFLIKKKIKKKNANYLCGLILNFLFMSIISPIFFKEGIFFFKVYFFILILFYSFFYFFLSLKLSKIKLT